MYTIYESYAELNVQYLLNIWYLDIAQDKGDLSTNGRDKVMLNT